MPGKYTDPGTYVSEIIKPRAALSTGVQFNIVVVGEGKKTKTIANEPIVRGKIYAEALTVAGSAPHTATLLHTSDENVGNATLYKNGAVLPMDAWFFSAADEITIEALYYTSGVAYTLDYVATDNYADILKNASINILSAGLFVNSSNYKQERDFRMTDDVTVAWEDGVSPAIPVDAEFIGLVAETYDTTGDNNLFGIALNGKPKVTITLAEGAAITASAIVTAINNALVADTVNYGVAYSAVASEVDLGAYGTFVGLAAPALEPYRGANSSIILYAEGSSLALSLIFGLAEADSPWQYRGTGRRPLPGQTYYVTYTMTRPDADYNVLREFDADTDFYGDIGYQDLNVPLTLAGGIAWTEAIARLLVVQVKDNDGDGIYTDDDYFLALEALIDQRSATDVVCLKSSPAIRAKISQIMEQECSLTKSNYKRYWAGVPRDTQPGNQSTEDTIIYISQRELRPTGDDVTRGRFIVTAPPNWAYGFVDSNGVSQTAHLDSCFASVMLAARVVSFDKASDTLFRKRFSQMTIEDPYSDGVRRNLSSNGVNVMTMEGGSALVFDSLTTDNSGDPRFEEPSASVQKDLLTFDIISNINDQLVGIVPDNPSDMVADIKVVVGGVLLSRIDSGDIGYYLNSDGVTIRDIDYTQDIVAYRDSLDARTYRFKYFFNLKYPAKRFYGEFVVDSPFTIGT